MEGVDINRWRIALRVCKAVLVRSHAAIVIGNVLDDSEFNLSNFAGSGDILICGSVTRRRLRESVADECSQGTA
jgi:hypothetical protein